jgi:hypothetical protein
MGAKAPQPCPEHLRANKPRPSPPPPPPTVEFAYVRPDAWSVSVDTAGIDHAPEWPKLLIQAADGESFGPHERARLALQLQDRRPGRPIIFDGGARLAQLIAGRWQPVPLSPPAQAPPRDSASLFRAIALAVSFAAGVLIAHLFG